MTADDSRAAAYEVAGDRAKAEAQVLWTLTDDVNEGADMLDLAAAVVADLSSSGVMVMAEPLKALHAPMDDMGEYGVYCTECEDSWPCPTSRLIGEPNG